MNIAVIHTVGLAGPIPGDNHFSAVLNTFEKDEQGNTLFAMSHPVFQSEIRSLDPQRATLNEARALVEACLAAEGWQFDQDAWESHHYFETLEIYR